MLKKEMESAINEQIKWELYSAYLYYSKAAYFDSINLPGFSTWMMAQAQEEVSHAHRFYKYVNDRGGRVTLQAIDGPDTEWASPLAVFEFGYCHEVTVTRAIHALVDRAVAVKDHATATFLQWYVTEQVEEEATFKEIVDQLKLAGDHGAALLMLDRELSSRTFTPAADQSAT